MYRDMSKRRVTSRRRRVSFSWMGFILGICLGIFLGCLFCPELGKIFSMGSVVGVFSGFFVD